MSNQLKGALYRALKDLDAPLAKPYREYTVAELDEAYAAYRASVPTLPVIDAGTIAQAEAIASAPRQNVGQIPVRRRGEPVAPVKHADPKEMAGQRINSNSDLEPLRIDPDTGFTWYQEEVKKPAFAKPRGRRVITYVDTGSKTEEIRSGPRGGEIESFEVAGDAAPRTAEVKVTLPSFQVGLYSDKRFPFKIHVYNENRGFDREDVDAFYGGPELIPPTVKRKYVENVLCYDMPSVIRAIQEEARELALRGGRP